MAKRKQDQSPTILKFFHLASPTENEGSSSEGVKSAKFETRPTLKTAVIDGWIKGFVKGWSLLNPLCLEAGYGPGYCHIACAYHAILVTVTSCMLHIYLAPCRMHRVLKHGNNTEKEET